MDRRTLIIGATGLIGSQALPIPAKATSEATSIPQIPDATIVFGEVNERGIWEPYIASDLPDRAIILGYQFVGLKFWPMSYRNSYASGYSITRGMQLFSTGPMNVWYRLPDDESFWSDDWYQFHVDIHENNVNEEFDHDG
jgi:hypothetical protein